MRVKFQHLFVRSDLSIQFGRHSISPLVHPGRASSDHLASHMSAYWQLASPPYLLCTKRREAQSSCWIKHWPTLQAIHSFNRHIIHHRAPTEDSPTVLCKLRGFVRGMKLSTNGHPAVGQIDNMIIMQLAESSGIGRQFRSAWMVAGWQPLVWAAWGPWSVWRFVCAEFCFRSMQTSHEQRLGNGESRAWGRGMQVFRPGRTRAPMPNVAPPLTRKLGPPCCEQTSLHNH